MHIKEESQVNFTCIKQNPIDNDTISNFVSQVYFVQNIVANLLLLCLQLYTAIMLINNI